MTPRNRAVEEARLKLGALANQAKAAPMLAKAAAVERVVDQVNEILKLTGEQIAILQFDVSVSRQMILSLKNRVESLESKCGVEGGEAAARRLGLAMEAAKDGQ